MNMVPGGFESEESDCDNDFYDGYYTGKSKLPVKIYEKSPMEQKKAKLMDFLKNNDVVAMREELDNDVKGLDIDENIDGHWNLLYHACFHALAKVVYFLVEERGATINMTKNSETPLMVSCYSDGKSEDVLAVVKALIKESTVIGAANLLGITPLMFASKHGHTSVVSYLLALNDAYDAIDNEGTNALFHAIDGKHEDIVKILIEAGIDLNVSNKFGCTAREYSRNENCEAIFELFPAEIIRYQTPSSFMSYNRFEDMIPGIAEIPDYFPDVVTMLRGMNCERFIENFAEAGINLFEFLTITDERLKEIGIEFKFERNIILMGLHNFHNEPWTTESLFIPENFSENLSDLDVMMMLANLLRQLVVIKSQVVYMERLGKKFKITKAFKNLSEEFLEEFQGNVKQLKKTLRKKKVEKPLAIKAKKEKDGSIKRFVKFSLFVIVFIVFKFIKK